MSDIGGVDLSATNGAMSSAQLQRLIGNYKLTPATLMSKLSPWWQPAPFLQMLSTEIAGAVARGNCGLLVSAPPRHGKSKLITVATPLWVLENFPHKNVIVATYGEELSTDFTREVKDLIKNNQSELSVRVRRDVDRAANFVTPQGGGLKAVGLRGTITGRGADVLIIDDYIKEPKEALSHDYLESLKTWYATVARTRLEPGAVVIVVATRWVTNDLHGHIERLEARRQRKFYKIIKIPAIAGVVKEGQWVEKRTKEGIIIPDILGRQPGEVLFPERYNREALLNIIDELGSRWFEAMFQQNPSSEDSAITNPENIQYISRSDYETILKGGHNQPGRFKRRRSWDLASTKDAGDFTVAMPTTWDTQTERFYIEAFDHGQLSAGRVERLWAKHGDPVTGDAPEVEWVLEQEPGSMGSYAIEHFKALAPSRVIHVQKAASAGSKLLKAQPFLAATEAHKVYIVVDNMEDHSLNPYVAKFLDEFIVFPEGAHDDIMDAAANGYTNSTGKRAFAGTFGRTPRSKATQESLKHGGLITSTQHQRHQPTFGPRMGLLSPGTDNSGPQRKRYGGF